MKGKNKTGGSAAPVVPQAQPLEAVLRGAIRLQARPLILEYLAGIAVDAFLGNEIRGPYKLLLLPGGLRVRAEVQDVLEIERELRNLAFDARQKLRKLYAAGVLVERDVLVPAEPPRVGVPAPPPNEGVVDRPTQAAAPREARTP